ncbi:chitinase 2-like [Aristolochia californica]|uniref:chitinase 2-like n=1 Tax=Aristolochia californica TaxID=171875 RepID=UPI0035E09C91
MDISKLIFSVFLIQTLLRHSPAQANKLFREYIGADSNNTKFSDVPINSAVDFHFIISFAIDYTTMGSWPTNGKFNVFWDSQCLSPVEVRAIKSAHHNVKVALSLGGDTVETGKYAYFAPSSIESWVQNAVSSLTKIIKEYDLDGIDIDYEHFKSHSRTFAECIGRLVMTLKKNGVITFASIAPFEDDEVQRHYLALWKRYSHVIDYVNFQFYAYEKGTNVSQFLSYFKTQSSHYRGGKVLVSFSTEEGDGGLSPAHGFFTACKKLQKQGNLHGIFVWSADDSKGMGFRYEHQSQALLANIPV